MKVGAVVRYVLAILIAALVSAPAALESEALADRLDLSNGTPGKVLSGIFVRQQGLHAVADGIKIEFTTDVLVWFVVLSGIFILLMRRCLANAESRNT